MDTQFVQCNMCGTVSPLNGNYCDPTREKEYIMGRPPYWHHPHTCSKCNSANVHYVNAVLFIGSFTSNG